MSKAKLIIAGPGAGKTYGMVNEIISSLDNLSPARYIVVITYTNSATENIKQRLSQRIQIPPNLFIGTMHSFLNKFIVIPFSSIHDNKIKGEKLFVQCQTLDIFRQATAGEKIDPKAANGIKKRIKDSMNKRGYITYDQTVNIAKECIGNKAIRKIIANRIQYLFIDEFQDTNNHIFSVIDGLRKEKSTQIYSVGDPEQYIQSFDSSIKIFGNIPILKSSKSNNFSVSINRDNWRSTICITNFLNQFNARQFGEESFSQKSISQIQGESVKFISGFYDIVNLLPKYFEFCDSLAIENVERCILAKGNKIVDRIIAALGNNVLTPKKQNNLKPLQEIKATLLSALGLSQTDYCEKYNANEYDIRKLCVQILKAIVNGEIHNENSFGNFIQNNLKLKLNPSVPIKIGDLRINSSPDEISNAVVVSNIHNYKGLESEAVLAIAKTEAELNLWLETDFEIRDAKRTNETTDYPRLGYVAFSRAKKLLCIGCLENIKQETKDKLNELNVEIV